MVLEFKEWLIDILASEMGSEGKDPSSFTTHAILNGMKYNLDMLGIGF